MPKSAVPGLFANPVVGVGASVVVPDAVGPDAAAVLLVLVFVLLPRVPVAGERRRKTRGRRKRENSKEIKTSPAAAECSQEEVKFVFRGKETTKKLHFFFYHQQGNAPIIPFFPMSTL